MKTALGVDLKKGEVRWCLLQGTRGLPAYLSHGSERYQLAPTRPALMAKFRNIFIELLATHSPNAVGYRVSTNANSIDQIAYLHFPYALLNLIAADQSTPIFEYNSASFTAKRLSLPQGAKPAESCDRFLGTPAPHWDQSQRNAAMSAWGSLDV